MPGQSSTQDKDACDQTIAAAFVVWPSAPLTDMLVRMSLTALGLPPAVISSTSPSLSPYGMKFIQWSTYDSIDHELTHQRHTSLSSSYTIRKALIRKHFLSRCIQSYLTKHDRSLLKKAIPRTWDFEISYADELDEMWSDELWDLGNELDDPKKWWILKPGMADRGMGIRLFNSKIALLRIFEEFERDLDDDETDVNPTAVMTSQLRHFVVQEYLLTPLLLDTTQIQANIESLSTQPKYLRGHKFHLRAYFVASGAITLYMCPHVLALFSNVPYSPPVIGEISEDGHRTPMDLAPHLTNTSLQTNPGEQGIFLLDELLGCHVLSGSGTSKNDIGNVLQLTVHDIAAIKDQMANVLSETFKAALEMPVHFQPLPNAFELFGVDFLVSHVPITSQPTMNIEPKDAAFQVQLLEINSEPAIELTGPRLTWILEDLFLAIGTVCIAPFFSPQDPYRTEGQPVWSIGEMRHGLRKCLEVKVRGASR